MHDELVDLGEGAGIEEELEAFARGLLACFVLTPNPLFATGQLGLRMTARELVEALVQGHRPAASMA